MYNGILAGANVIGRGGQNGKSIWFGFGFIVKFLYSNQELTVSL